MLKRNNVNKCKYADILIYLLRIADKLDIDLEDAVNTKIDTNEAKYPIDASYNNAIKYNRRKP